jgi:hypothetical protein
MHLSAPSGREGLKILGLDESAIFEEIQQAYHRLALEHHPDMHGGDEEAGKRFVEIANACARLRAESRVSRCREKAVPPHEMTTVFIWLFFFCAKSLSERVSPRQPQPPPSQSRGLVSDAVTGARCPLSCGRHLCQ